MRRNWLVPIAGCLAITFMCVASAQAQGNSDLIAEDETCASFFNYGAGVSNFDWCLSSNGNIVKLESPELQEHIAVGGRIEGYAVCSTTTGVSAAFDYAQAGQISGFGPTAVISGCSVGAKSCTLQRDTTDGRFRLLTKYTQNKTEKEINIQTTVTNISGVAQTGVTTLRYVDADMNNDFPDDRADRSTRAGWGREFDSLVLSGQTFSSSLPVFARLDDDIGPYVGGAASCTPPDIAAPPIGPTDIGFVVGYSLGTMGPGAKKTVKFQYHRQ